MDTRYQNRAELASFLRSRRDALSPAQVGLPAHGRRRAPGLRRDEVAGLASMSANYYERLEQERGPQPSPAVLGGIARGLLLSAEEREHLYLLAGQAPPPEEGQRDDPDAGLVSTMESLTATTIAFIADDLGTVLAQNALSMEVFGSLTDQDAHTGIHADNVVWRLFTDRPWRASWATAEAQDSIASRLVADLRATAALRGFDDAANRLVGELRAASGEFAHHWDRYEVSRLQVGFEVLRHPRVGELAVDCCVLQGRVPGQRIFVFRAAPGTPADGRLTALARQATPAPASQRLGEDAGNVI
jgi:transcriptional regulator with XRE-family HTH domain